jgi:hypothetical protein
VRGGRGEFRRILCKARGCVYGADWYWLLSVTRLLGVRGVHGDALVMMLGGAVKVNIRGSDRSEPADCGGVNVNESVAVFGSASG